MTIDLRQTIIELAIELNLQSYAEYMQTAIYNQRLFTARLRALRNLEAGVEI